MELLDYLYQALFVVNPNHQLAIAPLLAAGLVGTAIQGGVGLYQTIKGNKMKAPQSDFQIPNEYKERMSKLKSRSAMASNILPGQDRRSERYQAAVSQGLTAAREMGNQSQYQDMISASVNQLMEKEYQDSLVGIERKNQLEMDYLQGLKEGEQYSVMGQQRKFEKEAAKLSEKQALKGAGMQNLVGAGTSAMSMIPSLAGGNGNRVNPRQQPLTREQVGAANTASKLMYDYPSAFMY